MKKIPDISIISCLFHKNKQTDKEIKKTVSNLNQTKKFPINRNFSSPLNKSKKVLEAVTIYTSYKAISTEIFLRHYF